MSSTAYALREDYAGTVEQDGREVPRFSGGSVTYGDGTTFDLREALDAGGGIIVVADSHSTLVIALDGSPALKRVDVPADAVPLSPYDALPIGDLRAEAGRRGLVGAGRARKPELIRALVAHDGALVAGDATVSPSEANPVTVDELDPDDDQAPDADSPHTDQPDTSAGEAGSEA